MRFILQSDKIMFSPYTSSLQALESSFRKAGLKVSFLADCHPERGKKVHIKIDGLLIKSIYIEGDSPAQAVRDVAAAVRL
jgi:hypothetical protein